MDAEQLAAIRERANNATPGPWDNEGGAIGAGDYWLFDTSPSDGTDQGELQRTYDAEFVAHARTDIPALLDHIDRLTEMVVAQALYARKLKEHIIVLSGGTPPDPPHVPYLDN